MLQRKYAYLNCAYMSPLLKKVEKAGIKGVKRKRKPYHIQAGDFFHESEIIRSLYSQLIDNPEPKRIAIIPSVSYGMANVVHNIPTKPGKIVVLSEQFPSNVYPWQALTERGFELHTVAPLADATNRGEEWNQQILNTIDDQTRVVSMSHVHWSDGTLFNLQEIRKRLDAVGGLLIIDGTQSIGALPFSVREIRPDALITAAYKWLMGPYAIGLGYYGEAFDQGTPIEENWINRRNSEDFAQLVNYQDDYQELALRYEVGEHSNFILLPMLHEALKQLLRWGPENIQAYCRSLVDPMIPELSSLGFHLEEAVFRANHLFGIRSNDVPIDVLQRSFKKHKVSVGVRGNAIRVAPHVYNDEIDIRKLLNALKEPIFASNEK